MGREDSCSKQWVLGSFYLTLACLSTIFSIALTYLGQHFDEGGRRARLTGRVFYTILLLITLLIIVLATLEAGNVCLPLSHSILARICRELPYSLLSIHKNNYLWPVTDTCGQ
jgi:hypothetical protein